ncbi:MAG: type IV secretory system conjugative DNA transfer family protein [Clostridia bacterium]|nr:type IV secretory system conjugative DNA transfer family protein [Clostridia bacterium]
MRKDAGLEGEFEFGQKNITTLQRNLLNKDEILRMATTKLLAILRGNKPLLLDKMRYTEHPLAKKLKECSVLEYTPKWTKNIPEKVQVNGKKEKAEKKIKKKSKIDWDTF